MVCFFPGVVYLRDRVHAGDFDKRIAARDGATDYTYVRPDRAIIDATQVVPGVSNPLALGHLVRHPSCLRPGAAAAEVIATPNVLMFPFDFVRPSPESRPNDAGDAADEMDIECLPTLDPLHTFPEELLHLVPNAFDKAPGLFSPPPSKECVAQGAVLVALQDIEDGHELFVDYRFNPSIAAPSWYAPVSLDMDLQFFGLEADPRKISSL